MLSVVKNQLDNQLSFSRTAQPTLNQHTSASLSCNHPSVELNWTLLRHVGHEGSAVFSRRGKFRVMHVSPQTMLFHMQCQGPPSEHAELGYTGECPLCFQSDQLRQRTGPTGKEEGRGGFSAPAVIQRRYTATSADLRPAAGNHCNTGDVVKPAAGLDTLLSRQSLQRAGPQS